MELMVKVIEHIYEKETNGAMSSSYMEVFFIAKNHKETDPIILEKQDEVLRRLIADRHNDPDFMRFLFGLIAELPPERRRSLVEHFLQHNKSFEVFENLTLVSGDVSGFGSLVPAIQARVEHLESLLPLVNTIDYLKHRQHIEHMIQENRNWIESEKKRDFMRD